MSDDESLSDDEWINKFEKDEEKFSEFYNEPVKYIKVFFFSLVHNKITEMNKIKYFLEQSNLLKSKELIGLIMKVKKKDEKIHSMLQYYVNVHYENVNKYIMSNDNNLKELNNLNDIKFNDIIPILKDTNNIFIFFCEKDKKNNTSRKNRKKDIIPQITTSKIIKTINLHDTLGKTRKINKNNFVKDIVKL